jgi:hypothetical protein
VRTSISQYNNGNKEQVFCILHCWACFAFHRRTEESGSQVLFPLEFGEIMGEADGRFLDFRSSKHLSFLLS